MDDSSFVRVDVECIRILGSFRLVEAKQLKAPTSGYTSDKRLEWLELTCFDHFE